MGNINRVYIILEPKAKFRAKTKLKKAIRKYWDFFEEPEIWKVGKKYHIEGEHNWAPKKKDLQKLGHGNCSGTDLEENEDYEFKF